MNFIKMLDFVELFACALNYHMIAVTAEKSSRKIKFDNHIEHLHVMIFSKVDTACSSSIVALDQACNTLRLGKKQRRHQFDDLHPK